MHKRVLAEIVHNSSAKSLVLLVDFVLCWSSARDQDGKMRIKESKVTQFKYQELTQEQQDKLDAAVFRRLLAHLDANKEVQNIDLMILAGFCRNCFSKWYKAEADVLGLDLDLDDARERVYGMTYDEWKTNHQPEATPEQLAAFEAKQNK